MQELVSVEWLHKNLEDKDLVLLDASLPTTAEGQSTKEQMSISGSRYFDLKRNFADQNSPYPNTLPPAEQFEAECKKLGINQTSKIIVFDNRGIYSSPRVWWMFKVMGHETIAVLNGGLPEWIRKGYPVENRKVDNYVSGNFKANFYEDFVKKYQDILENIDENHFDVIDARSEGRFNGTENEPRKHLKSGHIPNSINIPYSTLLENGKYKSASELRKVFESKASDKKELVFSCGSGLTACIVMLASEMLYKKGKYIYDGSWTEWADRQGLKENIE